VERHRTLCGALLRIFIDTFGKRSRSQSPRSPAGKLPPAVTLLDGAGFEGNSCFAAVVFLYRFFFVGLCLAQNS
jgi:hypothetical protein